MRSAQQEKFRNEDSMRYRSTFRKRIFIKFNMIRKFECQIKCDVVIYDVKRVFFYLTSRSSTSNIKSVFGGTTPPPLFAP